MSPPAESARFDPRALAVPAVVALTWAAGLAASTWLVPADARGFVAGALRDALPISTIAVAALWHAGLVMLADVLRLPRTSAHVGAACLYVVAALWGDPAAMAAAAAVGLADLLLAAKRNLGAWAWALCVASVAGIVFLFTMASGPTALSGQALVAALVVALVTAAARRDPLAEILRDEFAMLAASSLACWAAFLANPLRRDGAGLAFVALFAAWGILHARGLQWRQGNVRAFHAAMIATVIAGLAAVDLALAPMKILLPESAPDPAARVASRPAGERVVPPGFFNNDGDPAGWWIETGFFRAGKPSAEKTPGTVRVIVQGSSTTACMHLDNIEDVWTRVMEHRLNEANAARPVEVINAGIQGTTTLGMLLNLRAKVLPLRPDLIVLYAGANDATYGHGPLTQRQIYDLAREGAFERDAEEDVRVFGHEGGSASSRRVAVTRVLMRSTLYRLLAARVFALRGAQPALASLVPAVPAVPLADFARNLGEFADECARAGVRPVFVGEGVRIDIDDYKAVMRRVATQRGVPYIDAQPILAACGPIDALVFDTVHLTAEGGRCLGAGLARELELRGLLVGGAP